MTPHTTHTPPRKLDLSLALSCAEDDFREECHALYEVTAGSIGRDLCELEALAELTATYAKGVALLLARMEYAAADGGKYALSDLILDALDGELQHGALSVVRAGVARVNARGAA